jgi:hypothetical protein
MCTRTLNNSDYANMALLIMYAWDMCDNDFANPTNLTLDPRILADGWNVVGLIIGGDDIAKAGTSIRQQFMTAGSFRRYGYLAVNANDPTKYVAVIRGTDGAEEWADDFDFLAKEDPLFPGRVESGFADIYQSMKYFSLVPPAAVPAAVVDLPNLADGIAAAVPPGATVRVLGHSLGSSLGILFAYDLAAPARLGSARTSAIFFASPQTGDHDFVGGFEDRVTDYIVINYTNDIVPDAPPFDIFHWDLFRALPYCRILTDASSQAKINTTDKACCHHLISYVALLCPVTFDRATAVTAAAGWTNDDGTCSKCVTV